MRVPYLLLLFFVCAFGFLAALGRSGMMLACLAIAAITLGAIGLSLMLGVANKILDRLDPPRR